MRRNFLSGSAMRLWWLLACLACASAAPASAAERKTILVYGDSLSAAYGIGQKESWVTLLQERLRRNGLDYTVANASISGETSSGGVTRIGTTLARFRPGITIVELGANDGLRGLPAAQMQKNLSAVISAAQKAGSKVLLVGMKMPPNYGPSYTREFEEVFRALAKRHKVPLVPFLLEGVGERRDLFQDDQMHPTAAAQPVILEVVWKSLRPMLGK